MEYPVILCKCLEFLLDRVNVMRIDAANTRLRLIAPVIRDHGVDYERGKFQDKLNDGTLTLQRTTDWIQSSIKNGLQKNIINLDDLKEGKAAPYVEVFIFFNLILK